MIKYFLLFPSLLISRIVCGQDLPKTILWEVTKNGNAHKSYLFGTFHEVEPTFFEGLHNTMSKLKQADVLFLEQKQNISNNLNANDSSFWTIDKWKILLTNRQDSIFKAFTTKAENNNYYHLPPLLFSVEVNRTYLQDFCDREERTSFDIMDQFVENIATKQNKEVFSLDENQGIMLQNIQTSFSYSQDSLYASISIDYMEKMLNENLSGCKIITDYKNFNLNYELEKDVTKVAAFDALLIERNKKWVSTIDKSFLQNNCFVAVGFRHLFYKQGLIQLLRGLGYKVIPIAAN